MDGLPTIQSNSSYDSQRQREFDAAKAEILLEYEDKLMHGIPEMFYAPGGHQQPCLSRTDQIKGEIQLRVEAAEELYDDVKGSDFYHEFAAAEILMDTRKVQQAIDGLLSGTSRGIPLSSIGGEELSELLEILESK